VKSNAIVHGLVKSKDVSPLPDVLQYISEDLGIPFLWINYQYWNNELNMESNKQKIRYTRPIASRGLLIPLNLDEMQLMLT
jgi:hypothetical protein